MTENMNPFYEKQMETHLGDNSTEDEKEIWKETFAEDFQSIISKAKDRKEADIEMMRRAVRDIKKLPDGDKIISELLQGEN